MKRTWVLAGLLFLGFAWHFFLWSIGRSPELRGLSGDEQTYWARAEILHAGGEPEIDLLWPPFYARFLSLCWAPLGRPSRLAVELVQVLLLAIAAGLLWLLARREGLPPAWAATAGAALFLLPTPASFAHYFWPEVLHLALFLAALALLRLRPGPIAGFAAGALLGLALLTKSLLTFFLPCLLLLDFLAGERGRRGLRLASIGAGLLLLTLPTLWRNQAATGRLTIADSSTFNLWVGLNDVSRQSHRGSIAWRELQAFRASAPGFAERDALLRAKIVRLLREEGLLRLAGRQLGRQYFRLFGLDSYLVDQLPGGPLEPQGQGYKSLDQTTVTLLRMASDAAHLALLALAGCGLGWAGAPRRGEPWSWLAPSFLLYNLLIFAGLHVKSRYLLQLLPFLLLAATAAAARLAAPRAEREALSRARWLGGLAAGALLIFCATAGPWLDGELALP